MTKTLVAAFDGTVLRPDEPLDIEPNTRVTITVESRSPDVADADTGDAWSVLHALAGTYDGPADWSSEHDHYIHGAANRDDADGE